MAQIQCTRVDVCGICGLCRKHCVTHWNMRGGEDTFDGVRESQCQMMLVKAKEKGEVRLTENGRADS